MNNREMILLGALIAMMITIVFLVTQTNPVDPTQDTIDIDTPTPIRDNHVVPTATVMTTPTLGIVPLPVQIDNYDDHVVFSMDGIHEFDRITDISYPYDRTTDAGEEMTIMMWFRRDVFNTQQFLISKGHHGDRQGWRLMVKETKPPYQYEQIQFDVGNKASLNYYKSLDGIVDHEWHSLVVLFNANRIYVDSKGKRTHAVIILDGKTDYYMSSPPEDINNPAIDYVSPYKAPMYIGRHSDSKNKYYFTGAMSNVTIMNVDIGISAAQEWHDQKVYIR